MYGKSPPKQANLRSDALPDSNSLLTFKRGIPDLKEGHMARKSIKVAVLFLLVQMLIWGGSRDAFAFKLFDGKLDIYGYVENFSAYRLDERHGAKGEDDTGNLANFRNSFQIEALFHALENEHLKVNIFAMTRLFYESSFDMESDYGDAMSDSGKDFLRREKAQDRIRELYVDINTQRWNIRLGKQLITWGEADGVRMADIINPLDMTWHFSFEGWEDIAIPLWAGRFIYSFPCRFDPKLEFVYIPTNYRTSRYAPYGANWSPGIPDNVLRNFQYGAPHGEFTDGEVGIRLMATIKGVDVAIQDFYSRVDDPIFTDNPKDFIAGITQNKKGLFKYPRMNVLGGKFSFWNDFTKAIIRGEFGYNFGQPFNSTDGAPYKIKEKNTFTYMLGFDRPTMVPVLSKLNNMRSYFLSGQIFQTYMDNDRYLISGQGRDDVKTLFTFLASTGFVYDTILPSCLWAYCSRGYGFVLPAITFKYGPDLKVSDNWKFIIGGDFIFSHNKTDGTGPFRDADQVYMRLRYEFD